MRMKRSLSCTQLPLACSAEMSWEVVTDFPMCFVSEFGDVVTMPHNKRLKGFMSYDGYPSYKLMHISGKMKQVAAHQLVAMAFIGPAPNEKSQVRHLNGSRLYCHKTNLKWGDALENREDTKKHKTSPTRGERNPKAKLTEDDVRKIRHMHRDIKEHRLNIKVGDLADLYGVHVATICGIAKGRMWQHVE